MGNLKGGLSDEKDPLERRVDRVRFAAGGDRHAGLRRYLQFAAGAAETLFSVIYDGAGCLACSGGG